MFVRLRYLHGYMYVCVFVRQLVCHEYLTCQFFYISFHHACSFSTTFQNTSTGGVDHGVSLARGDGCEELRSEHILPPFEFAVIVCCGCVSLILPLVSVAQALKYKGKGHARHALYGRHAMGTTYMACTTRTTHTTCTTCLSSFMCVIMLMRVPNIH